MWFQIGLYRLLPFPVGPIEAALDIAALQFVPISYTVLPDFSLTGLRMRVGCVDALPAPT
jgi:hypothetical protein